MNFIRVGVKTSTFWDQKRADAGGSSDGFLLDLTFFAASTHNLAWPLTRTCKRVYEL